MPHHILTTQTEPRGFTKLLALNQILHIQLLLRLSFYLGRNLEGYMLGTTTRFLVEIMEA
jgi:hypothetical protein